MNLSLKNKITAGFYANLAVVLGTGIVYLIRSHLPIGEKTRSILDSGMIFLFIISLCLLVVVFILIQKQLKSRIEARHDLVESERLLQSVIDSSANPITIKKLNGQYILVNKRFAELVNESVNSVIGRTDMELFSRENAAVIRSSDIEVLKEKKPVSIEEVLQLVDGDRTYLEVKFPIFDKLQRIEAIGGIATEISDRKASEKSLEKANKFFNMSFDAMYIADEHHFLKVNPAMCKSLGYTEKELLDKPWIDIIYKDDHSKARETMKRLIQGNKLQKIEARAVSKNGNIKWFLLSTRVEEIEGRNLFYVVGHEVTESKEMFKDLILYERFFNMSFDLMAVSDGNRYLKLNAAYKRVLGYDPEDLKDEEIGFIAHPSEKDESLNEVQKLVQGSGNEPLRIVGRMKAKDNTFKTFEWTATKDPQNQLFYGVARNINSQVELRAEKKDMLQKLQSNEQRLRLVIENISDGIIVVDRKGTIIMANEIANDLYQKHGENSGKERLYELYDLYYPDETTVFPTQNLPVEKALKGYETQDVEYVIRDDSKNIRRTVLMSGRPIVNKDSKVIAAVATIKDISRYKQLESEIKKAKSNYQRVIGFKSASN